MRSSLRALALALAALMLSSCAHRAQMAPEQRRECRRLRAKAALAGVGATVGLAVVATAIVIIAVASRGNINPSSGSGGSSRRNRRRERRRVRHQVCYEPRDATAINTRSPEAAAPVSAPPTAERTPSGEPPSEDILVTTFEGIEPEVRECLGVGPVVQIDLAIDGPTGRVSSYVLSGMTETPAQAQCLIGQLQRMRFQPFQDELRVRYAIDLSWVPQPPGSDAASER